MLYSTELPDHILLVYVLIRPAKIIFFSLRAKAIEAMDVKIEPSWKEVLKDEFIKPYFQQITLHLKTEKAQGKIIYPPGSLIFNAFNTTPIHKVKVVILGQDPYHGPGQAHGLCFSVPDSIAPPP